MNIAYLEGIPKYFSLDIESIKSNKTLDIKSPK
jgi:hypothetical protein